MPEYVATTPGLYPLPDWAKESLSDLKGHQKHDLIGGDESDDIVTEYQSARKAVIQTQIDAGLDRVVEGQLRWDDMLAHPLAVNDGVDTRGIVRYYDNNNFYRDPVVVEPLSASGDVADEIESTAELTSEPIQAVLPGPYSLADLATNEHYGSSEAFLTAIGEFLTEESQAITGAEALFLLEPSLVTTPPTEAERSLTIDAIEAIASAFSGDVVVHSYWGTYDEPTHRDLIDSSIDAIGYDLVSAPEASADLVRSAGTLTDVALGVVDGQNTLVETPAAIRKQLSWFESQTDDSLETVYVTPNTELFYLPVSKFEEKLHVLSEAVQPEVTT